MIKMLGKLIDLLVRSIVRPDKIWKLIDKSEKEGEKSSFYNKYLYPTWIVLSILSFAGIYFSNDSFDIQIAIRTTIDTFVSLYLSFYLSVFFLKKAQKYLVKIEVNHDRSLKFIAYSSFFIYFLNIFIALFPALFFLKIFYFYTFYAIWEGANVYMKVDEEKRVKFSILAFISILLSNVLMFMLVGKICKV